MAETARYRLVNALLGILWVGPGIAGQLKGPLIRPGPVLGGQAMANAFVETYIGKMKQEVLNHFFCFGLDQLDYINRVWLKHYHEQRPHRGIGRDNTVLDETFVPRTEGVVRCKSELGGILKSYYREAA